MADDITETQGTAPDATTQPADTTSTETQSDTSAVDAALDAPQEPIAPKDESATTPGDGTGGPEIPAAPEAPAETAEPLAPEPASTEGTEGTTAAPATDAEPTGAESAPSGGDGSQGTQLPEANAPGTTDPAADAPTGAAASVPRGDVYTPASPGGAPVEPAAGLQEASATAEAPAEGDALTPPVDEDAPAADAPESKGEEAPAPQPVTPALPGTAPASDQAAPTPVVMTSAMLSDGSIPQHGTNDAPSLDPMQPTTMFGGASGPSPAPDVDPATVLPHPALTENSPGFISGTTQGTQGALPVPGPADQAQSTASTLSGTANQAPEAATAAGDLSKSTGDATGASGAADATGALPVAPSVQETFKTLSDDGKAIVEALGKVSDGIGDVIALEFKSLANVAAHISGRLDAVKHELSEPEQRAQLVTVANQVLELLGSLSGLFGEDQSEAPLPPDVETVLGNLGDLGAQARDALYAD